MIKEKLEYKKKYIKTVSLFSKIFFALRISQIKILDKNKLGGGYAYKIRYANPWNPLTYIYLIIGIFLAFCKFFVTEIIPELMAGFKYR